jgi:hypothetical protein
LQGIHASIAEVSVLEGLRGRIVAGNRPASGSLSSLLAYVRVSGHWQLSDVQWRNLLASFTVCSAKVQKKTKFYLAYISAGDDKTL